VAKRESHLTDRQQKWMASVREGLQAETGRSLDEWVAVARTCPEARPKARQQWLKTHHGLGQNRAMLVLGEAFPAESRGYDDPAALKAALWTDPASRAVCEAVAAVVYGLGDVTEGARKGFTAWSRTVQFAAAKPLRGGAALLGLAVPPDAAPRLASPGRESWSERLKSNVRLAAPKDVDEEVRRLLQQAYEGS
jgi:hypothetical protein